VSVEVYWIIRSAVNSGLGRVLPVMDLNQWWKMEGGEWKSVGEQD
jgi:hypothetical protein